MNVKCICVFLYWYWCAYSTTNIQQKQHKKILLVSTKLYLLRTLVVDIILYECKVSVCVYVLERKIQIQLNRTVLSQRNNQNSISWQCLDISWIWVIA